MMIKEVLKQHPNAVHIKIYTRHMELLKPSESTPLRVNAQPAYTHPRMLIGDFQAAEYIFKQLVAQSHKSFKQNTVLVQAMERIEHGITDIEIRVLKELAYNSGFRSVQIFDAVGHLVEPTSSVTSAKQSFNFQLIFLAMFIVIGCLIFWQSL